MTGAIGQRRKKLWCFAPPLALRRPTEPPGRSEYRRSGSLRAHVTADDLHHLVDVSVALAAADAVGDATADVILQEDPRDDISREEFEQIKGDLEGA